MSQTGNAGRDLIQVGRDYVRIVNINIANGNWGMVILLLIPPFLLLIGAFFGTTYTIRTVEEIVTRTPNRMLIGKWSAEGYECPVGTKHYEEVRVFGINDKSVVAVKLVGDDCVPEGSPTFWGEIPNSVSKGTSIPITWMRGNPQSPSSSTFQGNMTIVDNNTFTVDSTKFTRLSESPTQDTPQSQDSN